MLLPAAYGVQGSLPERLNAVSGLHARLVTLTGPGGIGKTRLAIAAAGRLSEAFPGGVWFVPLADLTDGRWIAGAVLDALGQAAEPQVESLQQVANALSAQPALLVLDNLEHLAQDGASVVRTLLERVPTLACLVTSRQELGIAGERVFTVSPLPTPPFGRVQGSKFKVDSLEQARSSTFNLEPSNLEPVKLMSFPSIQLFVDRAQSIVPDFQLTPGNAAAVAALCVRLEGIPLAVELAAARVRVVTPAQMVERLSERFDLLVSGRRDLPPRHRSLRAAIEWSHQLLPPALQRVFAFLSVFRGGWTLEAAEVACRDPEGGGAQGIGHSSTGVPTVFAMLDALDHLQSCSLIQVDRHGEKVRFRMFETLREFAAEQLSPEEQETLARRHAHYFLALAEQAAPELLGEGASSWLDRLEREHDNLRAALAWARAHGASEAGLRLAAALQPFWAARGHAEEGRAHLRGLLALPGAEARTMARARAVHRAGLLALTQGDFVAARAHFEESLAISRELSFKPGIGIALQGLGHAAHNLGDSGAAWTLSAEALTIFRELGRKLDIAWSLICLGNIAHERGEYEAARAHFEESLALFREFGDKGGIANALRWLGSVAHGQGDTATAQRLLEEGLAIYRGLGDKRGIAWLLHNVGVAAYDRGEYETARGRFAESLVIHRELGTKPAIVQNLEGLAAVAVAQAQWELAARLLGAAEGLRAAMRVPVLLRWRVWHPPPRESGEELDEGAPPAAGSGVLPAPAVRAEHNRFVAAARTALGEEAFAAAWAAGGAMTLDEAVQYAMEATTSDGDL